MLDYPLDPGKKGKKQNSAANENFSRSRSKVKNWRDQNPESVYVFQQDRQKKPRHYRWAVDVQEVACKKAKIEVACGGKIID